MPADSVSLGRLCEFLHSGSALTYPVVLRSLVWGQTVLRTNPASDPPHSHTVRNPDPASVAVDSDNLQPQRARVARCLIAVGVAVLQHCELRAL